MQQGDEFAVARVLVQVVLQGEIQGSGPGVTEGIAPEANRFGRGRQEAGHRFGPMSQLCYERFGEHFQAFHELAACLICANRIEQLGLVDSGF